jgi:hypothetical protein
MINNYQTGDPLTPVKPLSIKLFVGQIPKIWNEEEVKNFFNNFGQVQDSQIIRDARGNHRGCAFVTFSSITEADTVIEALNENFFLPGATAKLQLKWADGEARKLGLVNVNLKHANKLFVTNLSSSVDRNMAIEIFKRYGTLRICKIVKYKNDPSKVFCFLKYTTKEQAIYALREMNGKMIYGQEPIQVYFAEQLVSKEGEIENENTGDNYEDISKNLNEIIFYKFKDENNTSYYYNSEKNISQWEKPVGDDIRILPGEMYQIHMNQQQEKQTQKDQNEKKNEYFRVVMKGLPFSWTSEEFFQFSQSYNNTIMQARILSQEDLIQNQISKRHPDEKIGMVTFKTLKDAESFVIMMNNQKLSEIPLYLEIIDN